MLNNSENNSPQRLGILILLCILSLFLFLGDTLFNTRGEPREAIVAFSMLEHGNWVLPINNGDEIAFKPPFLHWAIAAISTITGGITEYTSRIPSALSTMLMIVAGYLFYSRRKGAEVAFLMGLITLTNFEVHRAAYACRVDMLLSALIVLALYALYRWIENGMKGIPWVAWLLMSGAALTKGPVGVVLPCGVAGAYLLLRGHNFFKLLLRFGVLAIASLLPLFAWYFAAYYEPHGGERFLQLIYEENILRFTGGMSYASHINPWHYNVMTVVTGMLPYTLIALLILPCCWGRIKKAFTKDSLMSFVTFKTFREMEDVRLYSLLSILVIFIFYCIPASKRSVYLLPIYPFIAYFVAELMVWSKQQHEKVLKIFGHIFAGAALLLTIVFVAIRMNLVPEDIFSGKHATENIAFLHALRTNPLNILDLIAVALPPIAAVYYWIALRKRTADSIKEALPKLTIAIVFSIFFALDGFYQPAILNTKSDKEIALQIKEIAPQGQLYSYRAEYYDANRMHPFTINFYLNDRVIPMDKAKEAPAEGYMVVSGNSIEKFEKEYPQYNSELLFQTVKRSCDDRQPVSFYHFKMKE